MLDSNKNNCMELFWENCMLLPRAYGLIILQTPMAPSSLIFTMLTFRNTEGCTWPSEHSVSSVQSCVCQRGSCTPLRPWDQRPHWIQPNAPCQTPYPWAVLRPPHWREVLVLSRLPRHWVQLLQMKQIVRLYRIQDYKEWIKKFKCNNDSTVQCIL